MKPYLKKHDYIHYIINETKAHNFDNISRTKAYQNFYMIFPELKWAFLASIVSRNAGYNMTDLYLSSYKNILSDTERQRLFMTYERANWLIFSDAYPQLLIYKMSMLEKRPYFHYLREFNVSRFMEKEWLFFWKHRDKERLMTSLIINEQNVIQAPVIKQDYFKYRVFSRLPYLLQDILLLNAVIIPTKSNSLYGTFVHDFTNINKRIKLGKQIASIIFHHQVYKHLLNFSQSIEHTGSRQDYEAFLDVRQENAPMLRTIYPIITHQDNIRKDWYQRGGVKRKWKRKIIENPDPDFKKNFYRRRKALTAYSNFKNMFV